MMNVASKMTIFAFKMMNLAAQAARIAMVEELQTVAPVRLTSIILNKTIHHF